MTKSRYQKIIKKIYLKLSHNSRTFTDLNHHPSQCMRCFLEFEKVCEPFIKSEQQITFILPAFPAKSPNSNKTAGHLPDLGERLSLIFLDRLCNEIKKIYSHSAKIIICSDGRVFNDLLGVTDEAVTAYKQSLERIIDEESLTNLATYHLGSFYDNQDYHEMRKALTTEFSENMDSLIERIRAKEEYRRLFNGMHRFIYEDFLAIKNGLTKNKLRLLAKKDTYEVIRRSNAWSHLIKTQFPSAIRLSIHPQMCSSSKFGIMLLESGDKWATPWHRVVLQKGKEFFLVKRQVAESLKAEKIFVNDQFSHYQLKKMSEALLCA